MRHGRVIALLAIFAVVGAVIASRWQPCSGVRECYHSWRTFWSSGDTALSDKQRLLSQFAASSGYLVFSLPTVSGASPGLIVYDRIKQQTRLIQEPGFSFFAPSLSADNERLLFVKNGVSGREIMSCVIREWICRTRLASQDSIQSPVEIDGDTIAFISSQLITGSDDRKRFSNNDLFTQIWDGMPVKVTDLKLYSLGPASVSKERVVFSGYNGAYRIYASQLRKSSTRDAHLLRPREIRIPENSIVVDVATSPNDQYLSFRQAESIKGKSNYQYNLHLANSNAESIRKIAIEGIALSRGIFVESTLVFNELFQTHYRVSKLDISTGGIEDIVSIPHTGSDIQRLQKIKLNFQ